MFEAKRMLYLYVETPLHAGTGRGLGGIDLPIQRERTTTYPMVNAGGLKGCLRAATRPRAGRPPATGQIGESEHLAIFGPETAHADAYAGALAPHDARILLLPVRSLSGVFAWTTSADALQRFKRAAELTLEAPPWAVPSVPTDQALVPAGGALVAGGKVVLEDLALIPVESAEAATIAGWLADNALPDEGIYRSYWAEQLKRKLCILPDDVFRDLAYLSTEVATRVQLDSEKKVVEHGPWTEEYLPVDTVLYAPLLAAAARAEGCQLTGAQVLNKVAAAGLTRLQLGGDETIGRGMVYLRFGKGG